MQINNKEILRKGLESWMIWKRLWVPLHPALEYKPFVKYQPYIRPEFKKKNLKKRFWCQNMGLKYTNCGF